MSSQDSNWSEYTVDSSSSNSIVSSTGGHDYQFLAEPSENLKCSICLSVLRDPHLTSCCGNHFCANCIHPIKTRNKPCPICQDKRFTSMLNKSLRREVGELKMHCQNKGKGCSWSGQLKHVENHLSAECNFGRVLCPHCNQNILRVNTPDHLTRCPRRPFACKACGEVDAWQTITGSHRTMCPALKVPCPNKCRANIMRKNVKKHLNSCPLQSVACQYKFASCLNMSYRKDAASHGQQEVSRHLSLVASAFMTELAKRDEQIVLLQATIKNQGREISDLKSQQQQVSTLPVVVYMPEFQCYVSKDRWFSHSFLSHPDGYKLCLCVYPNGTGKVLLHISLYLYISCVVIMMKCFHGPLKELYTLV